MYLAFISKHMRKVADFKSVFLEELARLIIFQHMYKLNRAYSVFLRQISNNRIVTKICEKDTGCIGCF